MSTGYNPNRHMAGSPEGGQFASGDSMRDEAGQIDAFDDTSQFVRASEVSAGQRIVVDGVVHTVRSTDGDHRSTSIELDDGTVHDFSNSMTIPRTRTMPAQTMCAGDRVVVMGYVHAVTSVETEGGIKMATLHDGSQVAVPMSGSFEGYERPDPDAVAGYDEDGDPYAEDEYLPGDDYEEFCERLAPGQRVTIEMERRGRRKRIRGRFFNDGGRPAIEDSMGYGIQLNKDAILSMRTERQLR